MTPEQRERKRASLARWRARKRGENVPLKRKGRPYLGGAPRCPVCKCEISADKDCNCP